MTNNDFIQKNKTAVTNASIFFANPAKQNTLVSADLFHTTYIITTTIDIENVCDENVDRFIDYLKSNLIEPKKLGLEIVSRRAILDNGMVNTDLVFKVMDESNDPKINIGDIYKELRQIVNTFVEQYVGENAEARYRTDAVLRYCPKPEVLDIIQKEITENWIGFVIQFYGDKLTYNKDKSCVCNSWNNVVILNPKIDLLQKGSAEKIISNFKQYMKSLDKRTHVLSIDEYPEITLEIAFKNFINVNIFKITDINSINAEDQKYITTNLKSGYIQIDPKSFKWSWCWTIPGDKFNVVSLMALLKLKAKSWVEKRFINTINPVFNHHLEKINRFFTNPVLLHDMDVEKEVEKDKASLYNIKKNNNEGQKNKKNNRPKKNKNHFQNNNQKPFEKMDSLKG